jgi:hypothetical protein
MRKRKGSVSIVLALVALLFMVQSVIAEQYSVGGKPLNLSGYISQGVGVSLNQKDRYDTEQDFQSAITNFYIEGDYSFTKNLKFYASGMFTADWIYDLKSNDQSWQDKRFSESRKNGLYMDNQYWQLLKEAHITYSPENYQVRFGKQIIAWGETDGFRLMNQINPVDGRRGFADVEYESTIIPTWLLKTEYFPNIQSGWLNDLAIEFVWNPNISFIANQEIVPGNDKAGIWAPNARIDGPYPDGEMHIGSADQNIINTPKSLSSDGFEYGARVKGIAAGTIFTLNYWYGLDKSATIWNAPLPSRVEVASDGKLILHPNFEGRYDLFRFAGGTLSRDIPSLKSSALGGVAPTIRAEAFYLFGNTLATTNTTNAGQLEKVDELRWAIGVDWKVKIPFINPSAGIRILPQFYHRKILNYPTGKDLIDHGSQALLDPNNYTTTLLLDTSYMNGKVTPSIFWMRDINRRADFFRYQVNYDYSNKWHYTAGAVFLAGKDHKNNGIMNNSFDFYDNKDYMYFKVSYRWG